MLQNINQLAQRAAWDSNALEQLVQENEGFILHCAGKAAGKYITKSDDEWSIALEGFLQAVEAFTPQKGSFLPFAQLIIGRRLTDEWRRKRKYLPEVPANPAVFDGTLEEEDAQFPLQMALVKSLSVIPQDDLKLEIDAVAQILKNYGFSFFDLIDCSPKSQKTKLACARAIDFLLEHPLLLSDLKVSKRLPIGPLQKNLKLPRKILERHRKYIIAAVEILSGEYPGLASYMQSVRKEL